MKLVGDKANNYFTNPDNSHTAILIYGSDTMRVALRRQELLEALLGDNAEEEMRLTRISGSDLRSDPALLLDGLKASGFFPGPRAVFVEGVTDTNSAVIDAAMQDWQKGDAVLVLTANQLNARSKLRKVIENNSNSVAIGIYNDPPNEKEIISIASRYNLNNFESDAKKDLIALTGSTYGSIPNMILNVGEQQAEDEFKWWFETFGDDFYVEINRHNLEEEDHVNKVLLSFAQKYDVKVIASNNVYYLDQEDATAHDILCLLYTSPSPRDATLSRMPSSA